MSGSNHDHHGGDCEDLCVPFHVNVKASVRKGPCRPHPHPGKRCCHWMQASGSETQRLEPENIPNRVTIDTVDGAEGITNDSNGTFKVTKSGDYFVLAAPQVGSTAQGPAANFRCWLRVNGANVANSNVLLNLLPNGQTKDVIVTQGVISLQAGDEVEVFASTNGGTNVGVLLEAIDNEGEPLVPSIIFSMFAVCCDGHDDGGTNLPLD